MSPKRKASSGFTELPSVGLKHKKVEPVIRKVEAPEDVQLVFWSRRERIGLAFDRVKVRFNKAKEVLKKPTNRAIMQIVLFSTKKLRKVMLQWLKDRLTEPSTIQGAAGLAGAIGYILNPEMLELIATTVVGFISLVQMAKKEKLIEKKDSAKG